MACLDKPEAHHDFPRERYDFFEPLTLSAIKIKKYIYIAPTNWVGKKYSEWQEICWYPILVDESHSQINGAKEPKTRRWVSGPWLDPWAEVSFTMCSPHPGENWYRYVNMLDRGLVRTRGTNRTTTIEDCSGRSTQVP